MKQWHLFYVFITFSIGMVSLGIAAVVYYKTKEKLVRYYLYFHLAFTLVVMSRMFDLYFHTSIPGIHPYIVDGMDYFETFIARYALMIAIPLFFHEFFGFPQVKTRNAIFAGIVVVTYGVDHALDFAVRNDVLRQIGYVLDETVFTAIILYAVAVGGYYSRRIQDPVRKTLATRIVILVAIFLPGLTVDIWSHSLFPIRVFPILYSGMSIMFTYHLITHFLSHEQVLSSSSGDWPERLPEPSAHPILREDLFQQYNISPREQEVVNLVLEGYSNQDIGDTLYISLSTVKTHLRNIYQKLEIKSRYELITLFKEVKTE